MNTIILIIGGIAGIGLALGLHWFSWYLRLNQLNWAVALGAIGAAGITGLALLFLGSDIADLVLNALVAFWIIAILLGLLQARSLPAPWWKGILSVFFEAGLAFLIGSGVNLGLQQFVGDFEDLFPGLSVYTFINAILYPFLIALAALAVIRPIIRLVRSR